MFKYFHNSFKRKIARRITKKYPIRVDTFELKDFGEVKFTNWENPLVEKKTICNDNIDFFKKFLSRGDLAVDIGANIGYMAVRMSLITGLEGLTICFDPNPYVFEILSKNIKLNPDKVNMAAHNLAITEEEGDFYYNSSEASFNNGGISKTKNNRNGKFSLKNRVKGVNLETLLKRKYAPFIDHLSLIKIDTEGYDKEIINSISSLLRQYKPVVISECFGKNTDQEKFEQFESLKSIGYSIFYFSEFSVDAEIIPIKTKEDMLKWRHFDLYAIHKN